MKRNKLSDDQLDFWVYFIVFLTTFLMLIISEIKRL